MKKLLRIYILLFVSVVLAACSDDDDELRITSLPVNYANVSGDWHLESWRGEKLPDGVYFSVCFDRRDHQFTIHQNLNSMYEQELTGSYSLDLQDDDETYVLSGYYSYGKGNWEHSYIVSDISVDGQLTLVAVDDDAEIAILKR